MSEVNLAHRLNIEIMDKNYKYRNWIFTINADDKGYLVNQQDLVKFLTKHTDKFVFQEEIGEETGRRHYQGCFRSLNRVRQTTLLNLFKKHLGDITHVTINRMVGDWDESVLYCTKDDTRVGDTVHTSPGILPYGGDDVKFLDSMGNWYPWQKTLVENFYDIPTATFKTADDRKIIWVTDRHGNSGKSKFVKFFSFNHPNCTKISFGTAAQLRSSVIAAGPRDVYFIDIPRTLGADDSVDSLLSVIEDVKNGYVVSSMYGKHTFLMFQPPHIICFSNTPPIIAKLSRDRWQIHTIDSFEKELFNG